LLRAFVRFASGLALALAFLFELLPMKASCSAVNNTGAAVGASFPAADLLSAPSLAPVFLPVPSVAASAVVLASVPMLLSVSGKQKGPMLGFKSLSSDLRGSCLRLCLSLRRLQAVKVAATIALDDYLAVLRQLVISQSRVALSTTPLR
jgi:hypothetical protein